MLNTAGEALVTTGRGGARAHAGGSRWNRACFHSSRSVADVGVDVRRRRTGVPEPSTSATYQVPIAVAPLNCTFRRAFFPSFVTVFRRS